MPALPVQQQSGNQRRAALLDRLTYEDQTGGMAHSDPPYMLVGVVQEVPVVRLYTGVHS